VLNKVFEETFRSAGPRTALVFGDERYTYEQLEDQVARWAAVMKRLGVGGDKGVALVLKNCPLFIVSYLAASRLGAPAFLLDPGSRYSELLRIFSESNLALVICEASQQMPLEQIRDETNQRFAILVRGESSESMVDRLVEPLATQTYGSEAAIVQYTSGTTGIPKCIVRSHRNLFCEATNFNETTGISADDRILCTVPLFHSHGFGNALLGAMYTGATLVLMEEFNRAAVVEIMELEKITVFPAVPLMFELLSQQGTNRHRRELSLRLAFSAGAPLPSKVAREFKDGFGVYARQLYGATELGAAAINTDIDPLDTLESVGPPLRNVRIDVLRESGELAMPGESGEIAIQSAAMTLGYLGQPELTCQRFRQGSFCPGDFGRKDDHGFLFLEGRTDWLVLQSGKKVDLFEVEDVIGKFAKVQDVAVVGIPGYQGEYVLKAVVVARETCREQEIIEYCRERMSDFKVPRRVEFVSELPRNKMGKVLRKLLVS
jgi:long-chain acyl-CoA synthetase